MFIIIIRFILVGARNFITNVRNFMIVVTFIIMFVVVVMAMISVRISIRVVV